MADAQIALAPQFDDLDQQHDAATLGMWIFLVTEVMFFGGLFAGYTIYRSIYPGAFAAGSRLCEVNLGAINTGVLICSSFTMAMAVHSAQVGKRKWIVALLVVTMLLGSLFLGIKIPRIFSQVPGAFDPRPPGFVYAGRRFPLKCNSSSLFLFRYMTGLHALHMIIGIGLLAFMVAAAHRGRFTPAYNNPIEVAGLYWHFVDIIWIFLFPLLYLVDLHK